MNLSLNKTTIRFLCGDVYIEWNIMGPLIAILTTVSLSESPAASSYERVGKFMGWTWSSRVVDL